MFKGLSTILSQTIYLIFILLTVAINPVQAEMSSLGVLTGGSFSYGMDVSSDGSVIVGYSDSTDGRRAFKYDVTNGMTSLVHLRVVHLVPLTC